MFRVIRECTQCLKEVDIREIRSPRNDKSVHLCRTCHRALEKPFFPLEWSSAIETYYGLSDARQTQAEEGRVLVNPSDDESGDLDYLHPDDRMTHPFAFVAIGGAE